VVIGFNTRTDNAAANAAKREGVQIKLFSIIYELIDQVKEAMAGLLDPESVSYTHEPFETLYVETPADKLGDILQNIANRKGEIVNMNHHTTTVSVEAVIPTRGLIGFETDLVNLTRGEGIMSHLFKEYGPKRGEITTRQNGVLVSDVYKRQMMRIHQYGILCAPIVSQEAALEALRHGRNDMLEMREQYRLRRNFLVHAFREMGLPVFEPRGAFYLFPSIKPTGKSSHDFAFGLLKEQQVAVVPGTAFGSSGEGHVRCCYATSMEQLQIAVERIAEFIKR